MRCYECAKTGRTQEAVALCQHCLAGLCVSHLRRAAAHRAHTTGWYVCEHDTRLDGQAAGGTQPRP